MTKKKKIFYASFTMEIVDAIAIEYYDSDFDMFDQMEFLQIITPHQLNEHCLMGDTFIQYPNLKRLHFEYLCNS